jgi:3'-5' exoribonuclease
MAVYFNEIRDLNGNPVETLKKYAEVLGVDRYVPVVLEDARFAIWSGSSKPHQHHYGKGGLARHTLEVVDLCLNTSRYFSDLNIPDRALFLAALYHDVGKMWDYEPLDNEFKEWRGTQHKRRIHHICRSVIVWNNISCNLSELNPIADDVTHAILAHHMQREWGSPVSPNTKLAWILSMCDNISARVDDCDKFDRHL